MPEIEPICRFVLHLTIFSFFLCVAGGCKREALPSELVLFLEKLWL